MKSPTTALPPGVMADLQKNLNALELALKSSDPDMSSYLRESHKVLVSHPETVHLLDDSEIALLIQAAEDHTKTKIIEQIAAKKPRGKAASVDVDDL